MKKQKSYCPQYLALEVIGDKWTLLIIRDMIISGKRYFGEFLKSKEKIASNILTNRLQSLEKEGILYKTKDTEHKQKIIYLLTQKGIDLFPILMENAKWSLKYKPVDKHDAKMLKSILDGGADKINFIMEKLKKIHLPEEIKKIN
ncbi:MAG: helix-turn-helix domain-containing protein [Cellulophaga sp.]